MSKRLVLILVIIAGLMFLGGRFIDDSQKGQSVTFDSPEPLSAMVGRPAPDFTLKSYDGKTFVLSQQRGKKVVLFFNEGIMCYPACWNQMAALGSDTQFNSDQVVSASIVTDEAEQWQQAVKKMPELGEGLILLDANKKISQQYDMLYLESSMHRGSQPGHTYLIIDSSGIVRYTLDDPGMGIQNEVLTGELAKI